MSDARTLNRKSPRLPETS